MASQEVGPIHYYQNVDAGVYWQMVPKHWQFFPDDQVNVAVFNGREGRIVGCAPAINGKGEDTILFTYGDDAIMQIHPSRLGGETYEQ